MSDFRATAMSGSLTRLIGGTSYLVAGNGIAIASQSNGSVLIAAGTSADGADPYASYVTLAATASLPNERALTAGTGIKVTDAGAGSTVTLAINDSVVATLSGARYSGSVFVTGSVGASTGFSGSLTRLADGSSYLIAGPNVTISSASAGITISSFDSGADRGAQYVVMQSTGSLANERVLMSGTGIRFTDLGAGNGVTANIDDSVVATVSGTAFSGNIGFQKAVTSGTFSQPALTTDVAPQDMFFNPQPAYGSATGANRNPGNLVVNVATGTNGGTTDGGLEVWRNGSRCAKLGPYVGAGATYAALYLGPNIAPSSANYAIVTDGTANTYFNAPVAGGTIYLAFGGVVTSGPSVTSTAINWAKGTASGTYAQIAQTTDVAPQDMFFNPQPAYGSATGANRNPGNLVVNVATPTNGGTAEGGFEVWRNGSRHAKIGPYPGAATTYTGVWLGPGISQTGTNFTFLGDGSIYTYLNVGSTNGNIYFSFAGTATNGARMSTTTFSWAKATASPTFNQLPQTTDTATNTLTVAGQAASSIATGSRLNGGALALNGGAGALTGTQGPVLVQSGSATMIEATEIAAGQRVVALCAGQDLTTTMFPAGAGDRVVFLAQAATIPTVAPVSGCLIWCDSSGNLFTMNTGSVITQISP